MRGNLSKKKGPLSEITNEHLDYIADKIGKESIKKIMLGKEEAKKTGNTATIPYANWKPPEISVDPNAKEYFGGLMSAEDKEKLDAIPANIRYLEGLTEDEALEVGPTYFSNLQAGAYILNGTFYFDLSVDGFVELNNIFAVVTKKDRYTHTYLFYPDTVKRYTTGLKVCTIEDYVKNTDILISSISANGTPLEPDADKNVDIPLSNSEQDGLISAEDKAKLDKIEDSAQVNKIESISITGGIVSIEDKHLDIDISEASEDNSGYQSPEHYVFIQGIRENAETGKVVSLYPKADGRSVLADETDDGEIIPKDQKIIILNNHITYMQDAEVDTFGYTGITLNLDSFTTSQNTNGYTEPLKKLYIAHSEFIFKTPASTITFSYPSKLKFVGLDVEDGVFVPQPNMKYDIVFSWCEDEIEVISVVAYVSGYEVS